MFLQDVVPTEEGLTGGPFQIASEIAQALVCFYESVTTQVIRVEKLVILWVGEKIFTATNLKGAYRPDTATTSTSAELWFMSGWANELKLW